MPFNGDISEVTTLGISLPALDIFTSYVFVKVVLCTAAKPQSKHCDSLRVICLVYGLCPLSCSPSEHVLGSALAKVHSFHNFQKGQHHGVHKNEERVE